MLNHGIDDAAFQRFLFELDKDIAEQARAAGCPSCGGALHYANYLRRPRGVASVEPLRLSLCCAAEGCRKRLTPGSVRFLGRRVYVGVLVVLLSALQQGVNEQRREQLREHLGVSRRTIERWCSWWRRDLPCSKLWKSLRGLFAQPVEPTELPESRPPDLLCAPIGVTV